MKRLGERLIEAGLASAEAIDQAIQHQRITGHRLGDCLVELGLVQETALLRFLATEFKTRYVSADKLAKATISPDVLDKVPVRMAEAQCFLPIAYDAERLILSVVMAEPQKIDLVREIALVTEMNEVFPFIGVRSAIQAAIRKHYYGDPTAFAALESGVQALPRPSTPSGTIREPYDSDASSRTSSGSGRSSSRVNATHLREALGAVRGSIGENDFLETLNIMVSLLEMPRKDFRSHSAHVARQSAIIARRIGVPPRDVANTQIAAYLHDLGKKPERHLTLPLLASNADFRAEAKRHVRAPIKLFETVHLPTQVNSLLAHVYEAFDGSGLPQGVKGEDIPVGARIIAAVDAFLDYTRNPFNPTGRILPKHEALDMLHAQGGILFDPVVVDALITLQSGDLLKQRVETDGRQIFIADPDEATRTDLMDAVSRMGLVAQAVVKLDGAIDAVISNDADTVAVGLGYGVNDLVALCQFVRARPESASLPVLVLGEPSDAQTKERLLQAGVTGFIPISSNLDDAAVIIRSAYADRVEQGGPGHVVRGSFDELAPAELVKVIGSGRKSGKLQIRHGPHEGLIQIERGRVVHAVYAEKKGEPAVNELLALPQAEFQFDPESVLTEMPNVDKDLEVLGRQLAAST
jgi:response regulator RpfG family c-di-GMP phosphodiesterase/DNA-binding NarL/FixJ family response regulator